jgi:DNA-binding CsgD family transcriptional regulator
MKAISHIDIEAGPDISARAPQEGVIIADAQFRILALDRQAEAILRGQIGYEMAVDTVRLPAHLQDVASKLNTTDENFLYANIDIGTVEFGCRIFRVQPLNGVTGGAFFALHLKRTPSLNHSLEKVVEMYHLTERESEILKGISLGLTSKALAKRMNISPNTVNSFLRMIMIKLGVTTRAGIVGIALKDNSAGDGFGMRMPRGRSSTESLSLGVRRGAES